jgi:hypothetical protein
MFEHLTGLVVLGLVACAADAGPAPAAPIANVKPAIKPPPPAVGVSARCRAIPAAKDSPDEIASCPDPMALSRGDGIGTSEGAPKVTPTALPPWDLGASRDFACAYACAATTATAHLLAWSIIEDSRPLRNHNAAYLVEQPGMWTVVVMYRHATNTAWNINSSPHGRETPIVTFDHLPSAAEVDRVIAHNRWQYDHEPEARGFRVLAGNTLDDVWTTVLHGAAPRHFPAGIEH